MFGSTAKKQLIQLQEDEFTPAKAIVGCDINSWMETHQKSMPKKQNPSKFKITKKLPPKCSLNSPTDSTPTIQDLKRRKQELMRSSLKTSYHKGSNLSTQGRTNETEKQLSSQNKIGRQLMLRLPLFHVNQFVTEDAPQKKTNQYTLIPLSKPFIANDMKSSLKRSSLQKLKKKTQQDNIFSFELRKPGLGQILKQNSSRNNYVAYNMISIKKNSERILKQHKINYDKNSFFVE